MTRMKKTAKEQSTAIRRRTHEIRRLIDRMDFVCAGNMTVRTKTCGRPGCRCALDPDARHGPYYEWSRHQHGRLVHRTVSAEQADMLVKGIENRAAILELLVRWEEQTLDEVLGPPKKKRQ